MRRRSSYTDSDDPNSNFDDAFYADGEETFYIHGREVTVQDALHVVKDGVEYVFIGDTPYPITGPSHKGTGSSILRPLIFYAVLGALVYFIGIPLIAGLFATPVSSPGSQPHFTVSNPPVSPVTTQIEYIKRSYQWTYNNYRYTYSTSIPKSLYEYFKNQPHNRNYAQYAISDRDRRVMGQIASTFEAKTSGDSPHNSAYNVIAFVQSLPYFTDKISTGFDEYPRYPIETIVDGGGDCEDTAILTAALLKEMNYDVVLLALPKHMAIGVTCSNCKGTYYIYNGKKYFYLETTSGGWKVGSIPTSLKGAQARVYPI